MQKLNIASERALVAIKEAKTEKIAQVEEILSMENARKLSGMKMPSRTVRTIWIFRVFWPSKRSSTARFVGNVVCFRTSGARKAWSNWRICRTRLRHQINYWNGSNKQKRGISLSVAEHKMQLTSNSVFMMQYCELDKTKECCICIEESEGIEKKMKVSADCCDQVAWWREKGVWVSDQIWQKLCQESWTTARKAWWVD